MKSAYIVAAGVFVVASVHAQCECDPADSACLSECVGNANDCISKCHSNECYSNCISYHWPGADTHPSASDNRVKQPTSTWKTKEASPSPIAQTTPTTTVAATSSLLGKNANQSSLPPVVSSSSAAAVASSSMPIVSQHSSSQWSQQSNAWPSLSPTTTSVPGYSYSSAILIPSASASTSASTSGSLPNLQISKATVGASLVAAAAAYLFF